jgi:hypothetical protein
MKQVTFLILTTIFFSFNAHSINTEWTHSTSKDEMTDEFSAHAISPFVQPLRVMGFPYGDVFSWLGVGCNSRSKWAYIGFG